MTKSIRDLVANDDDDDDADDNDAIYDEDIDVDDSDNDDKDENEASCGGGVQRREATCVRADGRALHPAQCAHAVMPTLVQPCEVISEKSSDFCCVYIRKDTYFFYFFICQISHSSLNYIEP